MMLSLLWRNAAIAAAILLFTLAGPARADSYTLINLGGTNGRNLYGIDAAGDVVLQSDTGCGLAAPTCYITYTDGIATSASPTAPNLTFDDGSACASSPTGFDTLKSVCNGNWIGAGAIYNPNGDPNGVYLGSGSDLDLINTGSADQLLLNSSGDLVFTDGQDELIYEVIENPTPQLDLATPLHEDLVAAAAPIPEPGSVLLLGTGLLFFTAAIRRKANR